MAADFANQRESVQMDAADLLRTNQTSDSFIDSSSSFPFIPSAQPELAKRRQIHQSTSQKLLDFSEDELLRLFGILVHSSDPLDQVVDQISHLLDSSHRWIAAFTRLLCEELRLQLPAIRDDLSNQPGHVQTLMDRHVQKYSASIHKRTCKRTQKSLTALHKLLCGLHKVNVGSDQSRTLRRHFEHAFLFVQRKLTTQLHASLADKMGGHNQSNSNLNHNSSSALLTMPVDSKSAESKVRSGRSESCNTTNVGTTFIPISIDTDEPIIESHKMPDKLLSSKTEIADSFVATSETSNVIVGDIKLIDVDDASRTKKDTETAKDDIGSIGSPPMISTFPINSFAANETKECDRNHLNDHDAAIDSDQYVNSESYDQMRPEPPTPRWAARLPAHVRLQLTNPAPTRFSNPTAAVYTGSASEVLYKLIAKLLSNPEVDAIIKQELNQLADHIVRICGPLAPYVEKMLTQVFAALTKLQLDIIERIDAACYTDVPLVLMFTAIGSVFGMFVAGQVESGWAISSTTCIMITQVGVWFVILFAIFGASVAMLFNNCIVRGPALVDSS